jgi:Anti-sigma-K factor rskA
VTDPSLDDLARRLEELPREAWDRPAPPPAPWPVEEQRAARGRRLVLRPVAVLAGSAALVAAGLAAGLALSGGDEVGDPGGARQQVELSPVTGGDRGAGGSAELGSGAGADARVRLTGLEPSAGGEFYELWLLGADGELVSLGSFLVTESGEAELDVPVPVDPAGYRYLDVSREPADGDPSHSTDSVLRGPTA